MSVPNSLFTTLDIEDNSPINYQFVYASQLYGTFFGVFVNFKTKIIDDETREIEEARFGLLNYKGVINMGITSVGYDSIKGIFTLNFKALHPHGTTILCEDAVGTTLKKGVSIQFIRNLEKLYPANQTKNKIEGVVDTEWCVRDGVQIIDRVDDDSMDFKIEDFKGTFMYEVLLDNIEMFEDERGDVDLTKAVSPRCIRSDVKVMF